MGTNIILFSRNHDKITDAEHARVTIKNNNNNNTDGTHAEYLFQNNTMTLYFVSECSTHC